MNIHDVPPALSLSWCYLPIAIFTDAIAIVEVKTDIPRLPVPARAIVSLFGSPRNTG
jgi:hypothetical protein